MTTDTTATHAARPTGNDAAEEMPRLADRLHDLARDRDQVPLGLLMRRIGAQGHAPLMLVVSLLMVLPTGMIPGVGGALGALTAMIGLNLMIGHRGIWLPDVLARREIPAAAVRRLAERTRPVTLWLRRHLRPRWTVLSRGRVSLRLIALILIVAGGSLIVLGALPVAVPLMGLPVAIFALGLWSRDGAVVAAGYVLVVALVAMPVLLHQHLVL